MSFISSLFIKNYLENQLIDDLVSESRLFKRIIQSETDDIRKINNYKVKELMRDNYSLYRKDFESNNIILTKKHLSYEVVFTSSKYIRLDKDFINAITDSINNNTYNFKYISNKTEYIGLILINILSNCLKYTKDIIGIETSCNTTHYKIRIWDDGNGFTKEDLNKVFDRFYKGKKEGSGLGMSIVKKIIDKHNADISVGNNTDKGAQYIITLPLY